MCACVCVRVLGGVSSPWDHSRGRSPHQPPPRPPEHTADDHNTETLADIMSWTFSSQPSLVLPHRLPPLPPLRTVKHKHKASQAEDGSNFIPLTKFTLTSSSSSSMASPVK